MSFARQFFIYGIEGAASRLAAVVLVPLYTRMLFHCRLRTDRSAARGACIGWHLGWNSNRVRRRARLLRRQVIGPDARARLVGSVPYRCRYLDRLDSAVHCVSGVVEGYALYRLNWSL